MMTYARCSLTSLSLRFLPHMMELSRALTTRMMRFAWLERHSSKLKLRMALLHQSLLSRHRNKLRKALHLHRQRRLALLAAPRWAKLFKNQMIRYWRPLLSAVLLNVMVLILSKFLQLEKMEEWWKKISLLSLMEVKSLRYLRLLVLVQLSQLVLLLVTVLSR